MMITLSLAGRVSTHPHAPPCKLRHLYTVRILHGGVSIWVCVYQSVLQLVQEACWSGGGLPWGTLFFGTTTLVGPQAPASGGSQASASEQAIDARSPPLVCAPAIAPVGAQVGAVPFLIIQRPRPSL
jgi:hypothetical protein